MPFSRKVSVLIASLVILAGVLAYDFDFMRVGAQTGPLTYPEVNTALQTKLPNNIFKTKPQLIAFIITQVKKRKMDKPLTADREDDLRQAGATEELIQVIRSNSPSAVVTPTPDNSPVDLGDLAVRAVNLIKPEYTEEARKARTTGEVKLILEVDETGRVTSVSRLTVVENGLTERAIDAARRTTFRPATRDGKPARGTGFIKYNFKISQIDVAATLATADALAGRQDCDGAVAEYSRVIDVDKNNVRARLGRGKCQLVTANYASAVEDLTTATNTDRQNSDAFFFLAAAKDFVGDVPGASENYEKAGRLRPELAKQPTFICLYIDRQPMSADQARSAAGPIINACNQALRESTGQLSNLLTYKRGIANRMKGEYDKAINDFESVRRSNPQFAAINMQLQIALNSRGLEAFNKKEFKKAFDDVSAAIQVDPQSPTPYINRCAIYLYAWKQYAEAITDCSSAIRLATKSSMAYNHRGYAYEMSNSRPQAIADYKKALDIDPQNQAARANLNRLQSQVPSIKND
ncbi:MAG: TonB family protein [Acidobacteria bacterium]|nr:TonB family protein [Acidobacteriota bacterium]